MNKKGLGKGLGAIFGDAADPVNTAVEPVRSDEEKKELLLKDIVPNPHQPRQVFDAAKLAELVESIKLHGVIQPLVVRKHGRKYEIDHNSLPEFYSFSNDWCIFRTEPSVKIAAAVRFFCNKQCYTRSQVYKISCIELQICMYGPKFHNLCLQ